MRFINKFSTLLSICIAAAAASGSAQATTASTLSSSHHIFRTQVSTGRTLFDTFQGTNLQTAAELPTIQSGQGLLIGATESSTANKLVYFNSATRILSVSVYGGATRETLISSSHLATLSAGFAAQIVSDFNHDGSFGVVATDASNGEAAVYFFGATNALLKKEAIIGLSATGYKVVGAADLNADGHTDLILQNRSTQEVMAAYLGGANGLSVLSTHNLESSTFVGWTASGMLDMNGDGHPDLILVNNKTGESIVNYYRGEMGFNYTGSAFLDSAQSSGWAIVVPARLDSQASTTLSSPNATIDASTLTTSALATSTASFTPQPATTSSSVPVLIYNGTGTSSGDVAAVESLVTSMGLHYHTANSSQLNSLSQSQLLAYRLFLMPGGNAITISAYLSKTATSNLRNAVSNGLNYLGICAGGFFSGSSAYHNFTDLTSGVWFNVYNTGSGTGKRAISISFPGGVKRDIYWQDGPNLNGWGKIVAKYPNGATAMSEGFYGKGFVLLSAVHPEAPASWRYGMSFYTSLDQDLALARTLVTSALNRSMMAHY